MSGSVVPMPGYASRVCVKRASATHLCLRAGWGVFRATPGIVYRARKSPQRIVCLTEEPTEILYALGQQDRIVGISAYTVRPPEAKRDKPIVSAFIGGSIDKIEALKPDLVVGFSDIQADLARDLIKRNLPVLIFNQRSIQEILDVIMQLGSLVGCQDRARALVDGYIAHLSDVKAKAAALPKRPRVYFEEWDDPGITAIQWVSELIELAGGENVFSDRANGKLASERFVNDDEILRARPELIVGCWCGKAVDIPSVKERDGYRALPAVQNNFVVEMDPAIILQPGPACLTDGVDVLAAHIANAALFLGVEV